MLSLQDILAAQRNLSGLIARTPLEYSFLLSQRAGCEVYLKLENWQKTGSFKVRGAVNKISSLTEAQCRALPDTSRGECPAGRVGAVNHESAVTTIRFKPE